MAQIPSSSNKVLVKFRGNKEQVIHEDDADKAITPSELLAFASNDNLTDVTTAPSIDTNASLAPKVAVVDEESGNGIDDDYNSGDRMFYHVPASGEIVQLFLDTGTSAEVNVSKGDTLEPSGSEGNVRIQQGIDTSGGNVVYEGHVHFEALEDLDNSSQTTRSRIFAMKI